MQRKIDKKIKSGKKLKFVRTTGWLFSLPGLLVQLIFGWFPLFIAFLLAFQRFEIMRPAPFVGWENFKFLFVNNPVTVLVWRNTLWYVFLSMVFTFVVPILVAILLMDDIVVHSCFFYGRSYHLEMDV